MNPVPFIKTPFENVDEEEEIIIKKEYRIKYLSNIVKIIIAKVKYNIIIRSSYYELKYNINDLFILTKIKFNSIDEAYEFIVNIFNQKKYYIKEISSDKIILIIRTYDENKGKEKDIELYLTENFDNKNYLIKELFNKYNKIENEIDIIKNDNIITKEENNKIKQDNINLKLEIELMKKNINNQNNQIGGLQMQIMNMINQIQQQIYNIMQTINNMKNELNSLSYSINNSNLIKSFNNNSNFMNFSNNPNLMNEYNLSKTNKFNSINNNIIQSEKKIKIYFRSNNANINIDPINKLFLEKVIIIECGYDDEIHEIIEKYLEIAKIKEYSNNFKFIFDAKSIDIYSKSKIGEIGLENNSNIFVVGVPRIQINFKISNDYLYIKSGIISLDRIIVNDLIQDFLDNTGIKEEDIKNYIYNNKILNQYISLQYAGIYNNSDIIVNLNKPIQYIKLIFKSKDEKEIFNINCLKTEKFSSVKRKLKDKISDKIYYNLKLIFNSKNIDDSEEEKRAQELGIKDNSTIYFY